jgi:putative membrane protein
MKKANRILALALSGALAVGSVGTFAVTNRVSAETAPEEPETQAVTLLTQDAAVTAGKDETVYVIADAAGTPEKVIVSAHLKNPDVAQTVSDQSTLSDPKAVRGDAVYTRDGDTLVWNAQGEDVYYQGESDQTPPVNVTIHYFLDGVELDAAELAGQSGHVTIRLDYTNNQTETVTVDGETQTVHVPFAVLTGMILDNDNFRNVTVSSGRVIDDGSRCIVVGLAMPGLQDDLGLDAETIELPDSVEITADCTDFSLATTMTLVSAAPFAQLNLGDRLDTDELDDSMTALTDAMTALLNGTGQLSDGLDELLTKSGDLTDGVDALVDGAAQLDTGAQSLQSGAQSLQSGAQSLKSGVDSVKSGADSLSAGLSQLTANNAALTAGAKQVFDTLLATVQSQLTAAGATVPTLTVDNYATVLDAVAAQLSAAGLPTDSIVAAKAQLDSYQTFYSGLLTYTAGVSSAADGAKQLAAGSAQLSSGAAQLSTGAAQLNSGVSQLVSGAQSLHSGLTTLQTGTASLVDGVQQLADGASELSDGLNEFNDEGIAKLLALADTNVLTQLKAAQAAAAQYTSFTGLTDGTDGSVSFVYKTAAIGD